MIRPSLLLLFCGHLLFSPLCAGATLEEGYDAFERGDAKAAVAIWRGLAEKGDQTAQLNLGQLYRMGKGVEPSDEEAVKWYSMAARQGSEIARYSLLLMAEEGRASQGDLDRAFGGDAPSQLTAGTVSSQVTPAVTAPESSARVASPKPGSTTHASKPDSNLTSGSVSNEEWLDRLSPDEYLVQIVGLQNKQVLEIYAEKQLKHHSPAPRVFRSQIDDEDWFLLLIGPYASPADAKIALDRLSRKILENDPWIRKVRSLK